MWIGRFIHNCRNQEKKFGQIAAKEVAEQRQWWIRRIEGKVDYERIKAQLDLRPNPAKLMMCHGRMQGSHPIYLPRNATFTEKLVEQTHRATLHGRVGLTMATVREKYWVPKLRSLVKSVRIKCYGCKRFRVKPITIPAPRIESICMLPVDRTTLGGAFEVAGVDFAGPIRYKRAKKKEGKAYLAIFACSLSRAVHL